MISNPYEVVEKQDKAKHKSRFEWLYDPNKGVRWDHDPIMLRNLAQEEAWTGMMIQSIVKEVSKTPWQISEVEEDGAETQKRFDKNPFDREIVSKQAEDGEAEAARELLDNPNPDDDYNDLIEMIVADLLETGSLAIIKDYAESDYDGNELVSDDPTLLNLMPTDPATFTKDYKDKTGVLSGFWQYDRSTGMNATRRGGVKEPMFFKPQEMVWSDLYPRSNRRYGLPPTLLIKDQLELLNLTVDQEKLYFSKGSMPNGMVVGENWSIKDIKSIQEELIAETKGQPEKTLYLPGQEGDVQFIKFGYNYQDLQFLERKQWYAKIIAAVFQVPMSVVGLKPEEVNRATFEGELENWRSNTLGFYLQKLERIINDQIIKPHFGDNLRFELIPGTSDEQKAKISKRVVQEWNSNAITLNELRKQLGYNQLDDERGDKFKHELMPDEPQQPQEEPGDTQDLQGLLQGSNEKQKKSSDEPLRGDEDDWHLFNYQPSDVGDIKEEITPEVEEVWNEILSDDEILEAIEVSASDEAQKSLTGISRKVREIIENNEVVGKIKDKLRDEITEHVKETLEDTVSETDVDIDEDPVIERIQNRDMKFANDYADRMEEEIRDVVSEGWSDGKTVEEIKDNLQEKAEDFSDYQAERIARDQLQRSTGEARNEFAKQHDDKFVEVWLASDDNRTRDPHSEMDGLWKRPNEKFVVDYSVGDFDGARDVKEEFPGDSKYGINCRCSTLLKPIDEVDDEDHNGV